MTAVALQTTFNEPVYPDDDHLTMAAVYAYFVSRYSCAEAIVDGRILAPVYSGCKATFASHFGTSILAALRVRAASDPVFAERLFAIEPRQIFDQIWHHFVQRWWRNNFNRDYPITVDQVLFESAKTEILISAKIDAANWKLIDERAFRQGLTRTDQRLVAEILDTPAFSGRCHLHTAASASAGPNPVVITDPTWRQLDDHISVIARHNRDLGLPDDFRGLEPYARDKSDERHLRLVFA